jgi:hypothetical protein
MESKGSCPVETHCNVSLQHRAQPQLITYSSNLKRITKIKLDNNNHGGLKAPVP